MFIYKYAKGNLLYQCSQAAGMDYNSINRSRQKFPQSAAIEFYVQDIKQFKFGGTVEMDESLFGRKVIVKTINHHRYIKLL